MKDLSGTTALVTGASLGRRRLAAYRPRPDPGDSDAASHLSGTVITVRPPVGYGPMQLAGIRGLGLDAAQGRGVTETAVPAETSAGTAGCDVALCLRRDVPALGQEPQHEQRFADEREGGDIDGVARYEQCAGAADQVAGARDDEQDTENPGNIA